MERAIVDDAREISPPVWRRLVGTAGGVFLGGVLLIAAWAKMLDPQAFARTIAAEGLDFLLPAGAVALIALAIEVALGGALVLGLRRPWVLWPSAALVVFFLFLTGRAYWRFAHGELPADAGCGCFGNLVERTPAEAFWQDLLLMVPALALAFAGRGDGGRRPRLRLALVGVATAAALVFAWRAPELPIDDLATRLKKGVAAAELCAGSAEDGTEVCLDRIVPELAQGEHLVVISELDEEEFLARVEAMNDYVWNGGEPPLWVISAADEETRFGFRFSHAPRFEVREAPAPLLRPLYRTLPRSFRVRDGVVVETYRGLPPPFAAAVADGAGSL
ncbi:MAG: hypothetical protein D6696_04400 [Acidobacteria bacterium]|nr:MAG: hypothetical protein D6696_04400 [Acidobacteriota bacterium]